MSLRIVIADDDALQRKLVALKLRGAGYEVTVAADGLEALAMIRDTRPDVVVSDVLMPVLDGFELCKAVCADPDVRDIPVLLITNTYVEPSDRRLALRAGAQDLILRTPDLADVFKVLSAIQPKAT